jgi:hypothetical protein
MGVSWSDEKRWRSAVEGGDFGVWDLDLSSETVHYSPRWKLHLGFPQPEAADLAAFWRCRVHPDDLSPMLLALRHHVDGFTAGYEARFRLRSNGSGYRLMHSRGRVVSRDAEGAPLRMVGTMVDLTDRPSSPPSSLFVEAPDPPQEPGLPLPFHRLLGICAQLQAGQPASPGLLAQVDDLLELSLRQVSLRL